MGNCLKPLKEQPPLIAPKPFIIPPISSTSLFLNAFLTSGYIHIIKLKYYMKSGARKHESETLQLCGIEQGNEEIQTIHGHKW